MELTLKFFVCAVTTVFVCYLVVAHEVNIITTTLLKRKLYESIKNISHMEVIDYSSLSGPGSFKFDVIVVSDEFKGQKDLARHRWIHKILANEMKDIHALSIKAITVEEWHKERPPGSSGKMIHSS